MNTLEFRYRFRELTKDGYQEWFEYLTIKDIERGGAMTTADVVARDVWIGQVDKRGVKIYNRDFIKHPKFNMAYSNRRKCSDAISQVIWIDGLCESPELEPNKRNLDKDPSIFNSIPHFSNRELFNPKGYRHTDWSCFSKCEVICTPYDIPEYLKDILLQYSMSHPWFSMDSSAAPVSPEGGEETEG